MRRRISLSLAVLGVALSALAAKCPSEASPLKADHTIDIVLAVNQEGQLCPSKVGVPESAKCIPEGSKKAGSACVQKGTSLAWRSTAAFAVHFDPLEEGRSLDASCKDHVCQTKTLKIKEKAPPLEPGQTVEYKYTVLVEGCRQPLDPGVFIQR